MNHQIQNYVLVDNEWVSRPVDAYQILAQARESDSEMPDAISKPTPQAAPQLGILSRTLLSSPVFKFVRPAHIRHKDLNDIVLVGEDSVQVKEICDYGHLRHVATKTDLPGRILAARVFGGPREVPMNVGSPLPHNRALHRGRRSMTGDHDSALPPEVIVLALTSRTLMFLWARNTPSGAVAFSQQSIKLPAGASRFDRFGSFLAIDPKCRAMAVAASEGRFILYKTKHMERWRQELRNEDVTTPIEDERIIAIEGRIKHMEFLSSGAGLDDYHVVLLFLIVHQGKTKITCFDWDCREDLSQATARTEKVLIDLEDQNPSLLIPLTRTPDFILVFGTHLSVYEDVLSGVPQRTATSIFSDVLLPILPGDSKRSPLWVGWDKALRNPDFRSDAFYVAREDGRVMYVERAGRLTDMSDAGAWPCRIDTAFACLSVDNSEFSQLYPDVLIAGGVGNDSLLCKLGAWPAEYSYTSQYPAMNQFQYVESIPNWTPMTDLCITGLGGPRAAHEHSRSSVFIANGSAPHGELTELRHGLQSLVDDSASGMHGCTGIWILDHGTQTVNGRERTARRHYATFAITISPETLVIRVIRTQPESRPEFSGAWDEGVWEKIQIPTGDEEVDDGIIRDVETIAACSWSEHFAVQITRTEARILHRPTLHYRDSIAYISPLLLGAVKPSYPFIVIAFREAGCTYVDILKITQDGHLVKNALQTGRLPLETDPTCIELLDLDGILYVFISTSDLSIMLLSVGDEGALQPVLQESMEIIGFQGERMLVESAVLVSSNEKSILLCGTRNGYLLSSPLAVSTQSPPQLAWDVTKMGTTSAKITSSTTDKSVAFVSCGPDFCRVRCSANSASIITVESIWFTDRQDSGYSQSPVTAANQLPFDANTETMGRNLGGFLFAVAGDQLLFSQLESDIRWSVHDMPFSHQNDCKPVPRKLSIGSKPANMRYIPEIRRMVVSTIEAKEGKTPPSGHRVLHSSIKLLMMDGNRLVEEPKIKPEEEDGPESLLIVAEYALKHGERVYSIVDCHFTHGEKKFPLIVVSTGVPSLSGRETGRRLIFNPGKRNTKLDLQKESKFDHPVYATAMYSNDMIISAIGKTLTLEEHDPNLKKLIKRATIDLPSPGVHLTVQAPFVYVSTLQHSHLCYEVTGPNEENKYEFQKVFADSRERKCASHLVLDTLGGDQSSQSTSTIALITDKSSSSVSGLYHPSESTYKDAADTVFEACLPHAVVRLQRGDIRPPWRRPAFSSKLSPGIITDDIIGACSEGTIYTFSILAEPARHLLRFLQNVIEEKQKRDPSLRHSYVSSGSGDIRNILMNGLEGVQDSEIRVRDVDPRHHERNEGGPRHKHVDGDLIVRWRDEDGNLITLVHEGAEKGVAALLLEFAKLLGLVSDDMNEGGGNGEEAEVVVSVKRWLDEVLMPVL